MKILVLWSKPSGYLLSQLKALYELGVEVHLFVQSNESEAPFKFQNEFAFLSSFRFVDQVNDKLLFKLVNDVDANTRSANNDDIKCGQWRPVDITAKPFNVKAQKEFIYKPQYSFGETKLVVLVKNEPN